MNDRGDLLRKRMTDRIVALLDDRHNRSVASSARYNIDEQTHNPDRSMVSTRQGPLYYVFHEMKRHSKQTCSCDAPFGPARSAEGLRMNHSKALRGPDHGGTQRTGGAHPTRRGTKCKPFQMMH